MTGNGKERNFTQGIVERESITMKQNINMERYVANTNPLIGRKGEKQND